MATLRVISEGTGQQHGTITLTNTETVETAGIGTDIFAQIKRAKGGTDREVFDLIATGWSNGYLTVPALADA